jgi:hypothetical protein
LNCAGSDFAVEENRAKSGFCRKMPVPALRKKDILKAFTALFPLAPFADAEPIRERALRREMDGLPPEAAVWLCAIAHLRHEHTDYDALLTDGYDRDSARFFVLDEINAVLTQWRATRFLTSTEDAETLDGEDPDRTVLRARRSTNDGDDQP